MNEQPSRFPTISRRSFLQKVALAAGLTATGNLLAACSSPPAPQPTAAAAPTAAAKAAAAPAVTAPAAAQAAGAPKAGGTLVFATSIDVPSLEPHLEAADAWHRRKFLIYENLTWVDNDVNVKPKLAESWGISSDGTVYTFKLRQGVKFHNGKVLDADDVKYSLDRVLDPKVASSGRGDLVMIKQIDVVDKNTVKITLNEPTGPFLVNLAGRYNAIIPKDSAPTGDTLRRTAIGTGPFAVEEFVPAQRLALKKNPDYWEKGKPYLDKLVIQVVPDEQTSMAGLRGGTVDAVGIEDAKNFLLVKDDKNLVATRTAAIKIDTLELPGDIDPVKDPKVRQAILLALDKPAIMQAGIMGLGQVIGGMPPAMKSWALGPDQLPNQKRDVAKAKQLLAEAGFPNGFNLKLRTIVGYATMAANAPVIAANLKDVGINVTVETVDLGVWAADWNARKEPVTLNAWGGFMDPDLLYYRHFHSQPKGMDFRRWNNAKADDLLDKGRSTVDPAKRKPFYDDLQKLMAEDPIMIPLYSADLLSVQRPYVKGYVQHPSGWYFGFKDSWLDK
ncbi:MAG: ABC transporter substrate-binding protein [Chloroflexi bacterium]|nr:ABC transporter substrate-binding protein [Chloroflexota bacterium]